MLHVQKNFWIKSYRELLWLPVGPSGVTAGPTFLNLEFFSHMERYIQRGFGSNLA